jgi:hypothetical protein
MHRYAPLLLPLLFALPAGAGGDKFDPEARARALAPYLDEQTVAALRLELSRPGAELVALKLAELALEPGDLADPTPRVRKWLADFKAAGGRELFLLFDLEGFPDSPLVVAPLGPGAKGKEIAELLGSGTLLPRGKFVLAKGAVVGGKGAARLRGLKPEPRPYLSQAFAAAGDTSTQFLLVPTADMRRVFEEVMPDLPREIGGGPSTVLSRGVIWAAAGIEGAPKAAMKVVIQSQDAAAARKLHSWLDTASPALARGKDSGRLLLDLPRHLAGLKPEVSESRLTLAVSGDQFAALFRPLISEARVRAAREQSLNNLKQLAFATHTYHDRYKILPAAASYDKQGKPLLSWRVHLLPYIEQTNLYNQFKLDEPWDSPHNKKLLAKMPSIFRSPFSRKAGEGKTVYLAPVNKDTAFSGRKGLTLPKDFPDGTANTILFVEATDAHAVFWTKPEDLQYNPKDPLKGLATKQRPAFLAAFADGSSRVIPVKIGLDNIRGMFTRNGGEAIQFPE